MTQVWQLERKAQNIKLHSATIPPFKDVVTETGLFLFVSIQLRIVTFFIFHIFSKVMDDMTKLSVSFLAVIFTV